MNERMLTRVTAILLLVMSSPAGAATSTPFMVPTSQIKHGESKTQTRSSEVEELERQLENAVESKNLDTAVECSRLLYENSTKSGDCNEIARRALDYSKLILLGGGEFGEARLPLEHSLRQLESAPAGQASASLYISTLTRIGELASVISDYPTAKSYLNKAIGLAEKYQGEEHNELIAVATLRLAQTLDNSEDVRARALYEKALSLLSQNKSSEQLDVMDCLTSLASLLQANQKYDEAIAYMQQALKLSTDTNGENHPDTAIIMNNLAMLYRSQQKFDQSKPMLEKSLKILLDTVGPDNINTARVYESLADVTYLQGDLARACRESLNAARITSAHVFRELASGQSLAEQEAFLSNVIPKELSLVLSVCREGTPLRDGYEFACNWKGLLVESIQHQKLISNSATDLSSKVSLQKLQQVRGEIAGWYQMAGSMPFDDWKKTNDELTTKKETLERELANNATLKDKLQFAPIALSDLFDNLRADESFVDIFEYAPFGRVHSPHFAAVVCQRGSVNSVKLVDLGSVREAALLIAHWRNEVFTNGDAAKQWDELNEVLWQPVEKILNKTCKKIILCPDGELARLPWNCFASAGGALLTEVDSARQFCYLRKNSYTPSTTPTLLIAGGIDFNFDAYSRPEQAAVPAIVKLPPLPGTLREIKSIENLAAKNNIRVDELSGQHATKSAILKKLPEADYVHLATHGFFFDHNYVSAMKAIHEEQSKVKRGVSVLPSFRPGTQLKLRSPLVESGIAVSGANWKDSNAVANAGYITAEELVGVNLEKCKLMTLSACETGRGQEITGQGVLGLRAAIMSGGVRSVLMSMWKVSDESTTRLMDEFYKNLWIKHMSAAEALRQAQLSMKNDANPAINLPINWAAWVLAGEAW